MLDIGYWIIEGVEILMLDMGLQLNGSRGQNLSGSICRKKPKFKENVKGKRYN